MAVYGDTVRPLATLAIFVVTRTTCESHVVLDKIFFPIIWVWAAESTETVSVPNSG